MYIVSLWSNIFKLLSWISPFQFIFSLLPIKWRTHRFVDTWVFGHFLFSMISVVVCYKLDSNLIRSWLIYYGLLRVFEIFVYQVNVMFFNDYRAMKEGKTKTNLGVESYLRVVICLMHNFIEIIFWFTASYIFIIDKFQLSEDTHGGLLQAFYISFVTMTTFGPPNFNIKANPSMYFILFQSVIGLFMTLVSLARFFSLLPKPRTHDQLERELEK